MVDTMTNTTTDSLTNSLTNRRWMKLVAGLVASAAVLLGCEGAVTGTKAESIVLTSDGSGGYAPVKIKLSPEMSPVALNFRGEHGIDASLSGKWNRYRATLAKDGIVLSTGEFNFNYTGGSDGQAGAPYQVQTMMMFTFNETGEFELTIKPIKSVDVPVRDARAEVRRNIAVNTK
jgi:hypothetical protein